MLLIINFSLDVVLRCSSDGHDGLPDDAHLFVEGFVNGNEVQRTAQFTKEAATSQSWRLDEGIQL